MWPQSFTDNSIAVAKNGIPKTHTMCHPERFLQEQKEEYNGSNHGREGGDLDQVLSNQNLWWLTMEEKEEIFTGHGPHLTFSPLSLEAE